MKKLRAAAVSFLNAWPLTEGLKQSERIELVLEEPSRCAELLEEGQVDLALVSVAALERGEYEIVPGMAIGADGPVQTVVLAGEEPPAAWDEVYLDTASRTSHVLTKLVLDAMGVHPRFTPLPAAEGLLLARGRKGALVIGDRGFDVRARHLIDLGREWNHLTGHPMIFALWAARPGPSPPRTSRNSPGRPNTDRGCAPSWPSASPESGAAIRSATAATSPSESATASGPTSSLGWRPSFPGRPPGASSAR